MKKHDEPYMLYPQYKELRKVCKQLLDMPEVVEAKTLERLVDHLANQAMLARDEFIHSNWLLEIQEQKQKQKKQIALEDGE